LVLKLLVIVVKKYRIPFIFLAAWCTVAMVSGQDAGSGIVAFKNVRLIPMTSDKVMENQTVLVRGDRIFRVGSAEHLEIPKEAVIVDGTGKYLMPGLADMHVHLVSKTWETPEANMFLANGVTTIRDLTQGTGAMSIKKWCEDFRSKKRLGPVTYNAWTIWGTEPNIAEIIPACKRNRYDCIKIDDYITKKDFYETVRRGRDSGIYIAGHIPYTVNVDDVISAGMDELTHVELFPVVLASNLIQGNKDKMPREKLDEEVITNAFKLLEPVSRQNSPSYIDSLHRMLDREIGKLKGKNITVITTLVADEILALKYNDTLKLKSKPQNKYLPGKFWDDLRKGKDKNSYFIGHEKCADVFYDLVVYAFGELKKNDIPLVAGTDAATILGIVPGFSLHDELQLLVKAGFSPYEAIRSATHDASQVIKKMTGEDDFGTIETDKRADLILLDRNPLEDISSIRRPAGVMASGVWLPEEKLIQLLEVKRKLAYSVLQEVMAKTNSADSVIGEYKRLSANNDLNEYFLNEYSLTSVGYDLLIKNKLDDAIKILSFNAGEYPYASNPYYFLGEAYWAKDDKKTAAGYFKKALSFDPNYDPAIKALRR